MSEDIAPSVDAEPVVGSPDSSEEFTASDSAILDIDQYSSYEVPVKIDGEELRVPLSEAIAGYQRQADYTRKTQELAEQKQALQFAATLQTALENNPAATIDLLSRHYGISRAEAQDMVDSMESYDDMDPVERRMRELDQRIAQFEEYQSQQQIEREINRLKSTYDDFDANEVVQTALRTGIADLEAVYKQIAFDKFMKQKDLESKAAEMRQAKEQQVLESKRQAAVVEGGSSATVNTTTESVEPITSLSEAWAAAKRSMNADF